MNIGARFYPRGTHLGLHVHREAQLLFASSGVMQVTTPKGRWLVPPARAVWLPPGIEHAVDMLADIEMRALLIPSEMLAQHPEAPRLGKEFVVRVGPLLRETILGVFKPALNSAQHPRRIALLVELALFELAEDEDAATFMPMPNDARARRVADIILADPANDSELELLAHTAGASARTITRLFPAETNLTFKEWRQRARIMAAVEVLGNGQTSIKQLAAQLGFSSVAAFGHAFRQIMGMTPSEMMQRSDKEMLGLLKTSN
jgi:AraC-like DNA-binding protein